MQRHKDEGGGAIVRLSDGEIRDSVALDELEDADRIAALESLVLHFDFYGRLIAIEVTSSRRLRVPAGPARRRVSLQPHVDRHAILSAEKQFRLFDLIGERAWSADLEAGTINFAAEKRRLRRVEPS